MTRQVRIVALCQMHFHLTNFRVWSSHAEDAHILQIVIISDQTARKHSIDQWGVAIRILIRRLYWVELAEHFTKNIFRDHIEWIIRVTILLL